MNINSVLENINKNIDAAIITSPENRKYLTQFSSSYGYLILTRKGNVFFTDSRYTEAARKQISCCEVKESKNIYEEIKCFFKENNVSSAALEASFLTLSQFNALKNNENLKDFCFISDDTLDNAISALRAIKSRAEVDMIIEAQRIAEKAFLYILNYIKAGKTEKDTKTQLDYFMLKNGADALSFDTIAVSGARSSMPHGTPSDKKIENGDFITFDFGAVVNGYHSDMTRTVAVGFATDEMHKVYDTVLSAQKASLAVLKDGISCADADKAARDIISNAGYGEFFGHGTGHGVGIEIHEAPNLSPKSKAVLKAGNTVTVEPGIYLPGKFGVRIEDMAYITESGCENLTKAEKSLIIL